jgi:hypothetical protein
VAVALMDSTTGLMADLVAVVARAVLEVFPYNRAARLVGLVMMVDPVVDISTTTTKTVVPGAAVPVVEAAMAAPHLRVSLRVTVESVFPRFRLMGLLIGS